MEPVEIDSPATFGTAVQATLRQAAEQGARRVVFVDPDFDGWPLEDAQVLDALTAFVKQPGRRVLLVGRSFDLVQRRCPRFVVWRRTWSHAVDACRPVDDEVDVPTLLLVDHASLVQLLDRERWRGRVLQGDPRIHVVAGEIDAFAQRTEPTFGATTLGL